MHASAFAGVNSYPSKQGTGTRFYCYYKYISGGKKSIFTALSPQFCLESEPKEGIIAPYSFPEGFFFLGGS